MLDDRRRKQDLSDLIYDLPECFTMTWEELMDRTSTTTTTGYDVWNEILELENYPISTNGGRHFKPTMTWEKLMDRTSTTTTTGYDIWNEIPELENYPISTNGERHFKPQVNNQAPINGERHFKPQYLT